MNRKIDRRAVVGAAARWIAACALAAAIFIFWLSRFDLTVSPWMLAGGALMRDALSRFSGGGSTGNAGELADRLRILAGILVGFIAAPALFLSAWRALKTGENRRPWTTAAFVLCAGLTMAFVVPSAPLALTQHRELARMKERNAIYRTKDHLMAELNRISANAYDYWLLPSVKGGGGGSFSGYRLPSGFASPDCACEIAGAASGRISFRASAPAYPGSSVGLEVDSTGAVRFTSYEGLFRM